MASIRIVACCSGSDVLGTEYVAFGHPLSKTYGNSLVTYETHKEEYEFYFERVSSFALENEISVLHDLTGWFLLSDAYERKKEQFSIPILTTLSYPYEKNADICRQRKRNGGLYFCALSYSHKSSFPSELGVDEVVYNGIDITTFPFETMENKKGYLFSLGRIVPYKGHHIAIDVAKKGARKLVIGGSICDTEYFNQIRAFIDLSIPIDRIYRRKENKKGLKEIMDRFGASQAKVMYIGELNDLQKGEWYKFASCLLMPILWEEPFGLVMIEAMTCGTPVVAFNRGSVPEIVQHGSTGFIVDTEEKMVQAVRQVDSLNSYNCRRWVENNFTSAGMAQNYLELYCRIIDDYHSRLRQPQQRALIG